LGYLNLVSYVTERRQHLIHNGIYDSGLMTISPEYLLVYHSHKKQKNVRFKSSQRLSGKAGKVLFNHLKIKIMKNPSETLVNSSDSPQNFAQQQNTALGLDAAKIQRLNSFGMGVSRYGLAALLLIFGALKFTDFEARAIQPLVENSPLMSWLYQVVDLRTTSGIIGSVEIALAIMISLRAWIPMVSALGSIGGILMFLTSLSFLITTPGMWTIMERLPVPTDGGFVMKDLIFLGVSLWTAGEALKQHYLSIS
jgi:reactive chlorine resistance protein C